ncbi:MAG: hypothetical protein CMO00_03870 [Synechococcus sp. SAT82]|nr:hypothetical protein [Synechococcus sp. SAT82]
MGDVGNRLLIVDDDPELLAFLVEELQLQGHDCTGCDNGQDALVKLRLEAFDLAVLDWTLPDFSGLELCRRLRSSGDTTPVLMLTARDDVDERVQALDAGVDDYLTKPFNLKELHARVRARLRRGCYEQDARRENETLQLGNLSLDPIERSVQRADQPIALSQREFELLHFLVKHADTVQPRESILDAVWGDGYGSWRTFYDHNKGRYRDTNQKCALTRMEALISEMTMILEQLPNNTKIGITAFSSNGYRNNKGWSESSSGLARLGDDGKRDSAIQFVNTLDDEKVTRWGGTDPWDAIQQAFDDTETDTMYIMSDGRPNKDRNGGSWSNWDQEPTANFYASQNNNRKFNNKDRALIVNTTSLGLNSPWLEYLSQKTQGYYNQIDKESIENSQEDLS